MSSSLRRSGGSVMRTAPSRCSRSGRSLPVRITCSRSPLVAARIRKCACSVLFDPTGRYSPDPSVRSSFACIASGSSPSSSRNSTPPSASATTPVCEQLALGESVCERRAVDGDERLTARQRGYRRRAQHLSSTGFSHNENGYGRARELLDLFAQVPHHRGSTNQRLKFVEPGHVGLSR